MCFSRKCFSFLPVLLIMLFVLFFAERAFAQQNDPFKSTRHPVPRFVSLKSSEVRLRAGPAERYPVRWVYHKKGLPVEIIQEFDNWRKIRDVDGEEGWIHSALLIGDRTALILGADQVPAYSKSDDTSSVVAKLEPGVVASLEKCDKESCLLRFSGFQGWVQRKFIWGIYADEILN